MAESPVQANPAGDTSVTDSIVLEEEIDPNYVPSEDEVVEYAKWLGMDLEKDQDLFWVAREGLMAPLPKNWKPCKTKDTEDIYYFNFSSGESTWDHPCDGYYKSLYEEEKKKKEIQMKEKNDQQRSKAKQDVGELLGKGEKKKRNSKIGGVGGMSNGTGNDLGPIGKGMAPLASLERKPLPGIQSIGSISTKSQSWAGLSSSIKETNSPTNLDNTTRRRTRDVAGMDNRLASSEPIIGSNRLNQSNDSSGPGSRKSTTSVSSSVALSRLEEAGTSDTGSVSDADSEGTAVRGKPVVSISRSREDDTTQSFPASLSRVRDRDREGPSTGLDRGAESKTTSSSSSGFGKAQSKLTNRLKGALEPSLMNANVSEEKDQERNRSNMAVRSHHRSNSNEVEDFKSMEFDNDANSDIDVQEELMRVKQQRESRGSLTSTSSMRRPTYVTDPITDEEEPDNRRRTTSRISMTSSHSRNDDTEGFSGKSSSSRRVSMDSDAKDLSSNNKTTTRGSTHGGENDEYYEAAREHREEMETRRRNWQEEVDFHDAAVKKRREAMLREQQRLDEEQEALKKRRDSLMLEGSSSPGTNGPGVSDLRTKIRQLEMEIDEQKSKNDRMKEQLTVTEKQIRREKENLEEARREAAETEEGLLKQIQSSKLKTTSLKEERDSLELEVSRLRSELKSDKGVSFASTGGDEVEAIRQKTLKIDELEETVKNLNIKLTKEKQAKETLKEALEEQETKHEQALRTASLSSDAERRMKAIQESLDVTTQECISLREKLGIAEGLISQHDQEMEDRKDEADETIRQLNVALSDARNELDNLISKNKRLETVAKSSQDDATEKDSKYQQAKNTLTALQSKHDVLETEVSTLRTKLITETEDLVKRNAEMESQLNSLKKAKGHVESLLLASGDDSESGTVKGLMEQVTELTAAVEKEKTSLAEKDAQLIAQNARMETMEADMANVNKKVQQATTAATLAAKEAANVEMNVIKADLSKLQVDLLEAVALKEQLQSEVTAMSMRMRNCAIGCASSVGGFKSERQIHEAIEKITFLESQNASLSDRVQSQASEAVSLRMKAEAAESKLIEGNSDLESWQRKLQEKSAELVTLRGKVQQLSLIEVERDNLKRSVQSLEENILSLEATIKRVRTDAAADLSAHSNASTGPSATELQTKLALDAANDQINSLTRKIATLEAEIAHLQQTNGSLVDRMKIQTTETAEWHSKYQTGQEEIMALTLKLTASQTGNQTNQTLDTALVASQQLLLTVENERDQLKRTVDVLNESLRNKDTEMAKLRVDISTRAALPIAVASDDVRPSVVSTGANVGTNGNGFTVLSATVAEQQTTVRKLEEKLHAAEVLIVALSRTQEQMSSGAGTTGVSSSSQSPRRQRKQSSASTAFVGTRATASSSSTSTGRNIGGVGIADSESDDRYETGPVWYSSPELEEEKGHGRAGGISGRMHTHDMRDLWSKVMSTREPLIPRGIGTHHEKGSKGTTTGPRGGSSDHLDVDIDNWTSKIEKEQTFVDNLSATLRDDKTAIRREQETLGKRRASWRARKKALHPRDGAGRMELKAQSEELNAQTLRLNDAVEQTGAMHRWLVLRRKKLDTLQEHVRNLRASSAYPKGESGMDTNANQESKDKGDTGGGGATSHGIKGSSHPHANADITLDALERMGRDMDSEVEVTMMDLANHTSPLDSVTAESDMDNWLFQGGNGPSRRSGGYSRGRSSQYEYHQQLLHEQQPQPPPSYQPQPPSFHPPSSQPYYQPPPHYAPAQYGPPPPPQYHGSYGPSPRTERELFGAGYNNGNTVYGYYDHNYGQYPHPPQPIHLPSGPPSTMYTNEDATRWAVPAASVRFNLNTRGITSSSSGGGSSAPSIPFSVYHEATATAKDRDRDPRVIREQLKEITNRRVQSSEAFDTHASWLNNLQQEIGRFSHESAALATQSGRGGGRSASTTGAVSKPNKLPYGSSSSTSSVHSVSTQVGTGTDTETVQI